MSMNILILTPYVPYPINSGGNQGFFALVDRLRNYANISILLSVKNSDMDNVEALKALWSNVDFHIYDQSQYIPQVKNLRYYKILSKLKRSVDRKLKRLYTKVDADDLVRQKSSLTSQYPPFYFPQEEGYVAFVDSVIKKNKFDLIQVDFFELIGIVNVLPPGIKKVFIHHEIRYVRAKCEFDLLKLHNSTDAYLYNYLKSFEIQSLNAYDAVVAMTDVDKDKLEQELRQDIIIATSPAIVEIEHEDLSKDFEFNNTLVFLGGSDHFPNYDAVDWFLSNCWEEVLKQKPSLQLNIIGKWKSDIADFYTSKYRNVHFKGFVDDLSSVLANSIMITPIRIGSGVRMKILEALNYGSPLISTSVGCEGIGLTDKQDCFIADNASAFTDAILTLTADNTLCNTFRIKAKEKLNFRPEPDALAQIRLNIYEDLIKNLA